MPFSSDENGKNKVLKKENRMLQDFFIQDLRKGEKRKIKKKKPKDQT